ncbi:MAG: ATP-binding cassette domain-containing protein [Planctomycetaceae bacterium]|nr:MAG: ATP-binding cassette domain-containing protein [Planctomycetaceae bacterium]
MATAGSDRENSGSPSRESALLDCHDLVRSFSIGGVDVRVVDGVGLSVEPGELVVLGGPSGSGKTTLMMMAGGMLRPDSGSVRVCGEDPYAISADRRAALRASVIGLILPTFELLPYLDAADNVAIGYRGRGGRGVATELLEQIGLAGRAGQLPGRMSAGERRRLLVARGLVHRPSLVLADEPTANLDRESAEQVIRRLRAACQGGAGVLVITHEPPQLFGADRVYRMEAGRLWISE